MFDRNVRHRGRDCLLATISRLSDAGQLRETFTPNGATLGLARTLCNARFDDGEDNAILPRPLREDLRRGWRHKENSTGSRVDADNWSFVC
jgi:hypothetical protein